MYVRPIRPDRDVRLVPVELREAEPKVAVLLNANARRVSDRVLRTLAHVVPDGDLFISRSFEEARAIAETVVERRYSTVFTGGGDGTFVGFFNEIHNILERRQHGTPFANRGPRFGVLKLGTGNALANLVGASSLSGDGIVDDVLRARANEVPGVMKLDLLLADGKRAPFAGVGLDAGVLNHYVETKHTLGKGPFKKLITGELGYIAAIGGKSVPHFLMQRKAPQLEVRARGAAYRIGPDGRLGEPYKAGELLYAGPALMASVGTIPCYGFNFKLFPPAQARRGFMQLRVANVSVPKILANLYPGIWNGTWSDPGMHDFLVEDVEISIDQKVPFQIGGDAEGYRDNVRFSMWKHGVEVLDFSPSARA